MLNLETLVLDAFKTGKRKKYSRRTRKRAVKSDTILSSDISRLYDIFSQLSALDEKELFFSMSERLYQEMVWWDEVGDKLQTAYFIDVLNPDD